MSKANTLLKSNRTLVMGILNLTPDSFSDGGQFYQKPQKAIERVEEMIKEGVDIVDIGGKSTMPGGKEISTEEELDRIKPFFELLSDQIKKKVGTSIDTNNAKVAEYALEQGVDILNSVGGLTFDMKMVKIVKEFDCPTILCFRSGVSSNNGVIKEITQFFEEQLSVASKNGLEKSRFILDPGIGFGKTVDQNVEVVRKLKEFKRFNLPILLGISRKKHLGAILAEKLNLKGIPGKLERMEAGLAAAAIGVLNGARIIRTHDVSQTKKFFSVFDTIIDQSSRR